MSSLKQLKTHHREIARLSFQGFSPQEISERTEMKVTSIYAILKNSLCRAYIDGLNDKADNQVINTRKELFEMSPLATRAMKDILGEETNAPYSVVANVAKDVLDRNGYKAPERHEHIHGHFTSEDITKLRERADNIKTESYIEIDV